MLNQPKGNFVGAEPQNETEVQKDQDRHRCDHRVAGVVLNLLGANVVGENEQVDCRKLENALVEKLYLVHNPELLGVHSADVNNVRKIQNVKALELQSWVLIHVKRYSQEQNSSGYKYQEVHESWL